MIMYPDYVVKNIRSFKDLINVMLTEHGSTIAFSRSDGDVEYGELVDRVLRFANGISKVKCERIRIDVDNAVSFASAYLAIVAVGKTAVLGESSLPLDDGVFNVDDEVYLKYSDNAPLSVSALPDLDIDRVCTILHSSGTASAPKGIMLSQKNICSDVVAGLQKYSMRKGDRFIGLIPYYHAFGIVCDLLGPFLVGATIYVLDNKNAFFSEMPHIKPTMLNVPPIIAETMLKLIKSVKSADAVTGGCIRKILCGGAGLKASVSEELREYGINAYGCYGLSECSPCVAVNRDDYYKDGSAGVPLNCNVVTIAEDGEILVSGTNVMKGYCNDSESADGVLVDGVLHSGDLGYIDEDGFLFVTGRKSNLIVFDDGTKCSPESLEEQIVLNTSAEEALVYRCDKELRATLCARIYLPDISKKESVIDFVTRKLTNRKFDSIEFTETPLPKNATGKIKRGL